ncbi:MAG: cupin domain-containing protein [Verrucomicrobia bacterium]|nr:cupin domain-containing protein [Verrucomicrobiota bacterium]MBU4292184.1 cupin domain-containing protein [Verrucomicrobiota bacterium]MBU4428758.1 cupin domain-containing protein [Verrucomicrobiota bacterium]MCG2681628.1 cupin domain-containing protein [Kiritimatiellia bacterium]
MKSKTTLKGQVLDLKRLIGYSKASIVSQTLMDKPAGTLTLFAFDAGQGLSEHTAPYDAVVQILDGEAELVIGGKTVKAVAGRTVIMPARVPHAVRATTKFKMLLTMIRQK